MGDIGLQHVGRAQRQDVAEAPLGEQPLARGHRDRDRRGDLGQRPRVLRQDRLLEEEDVELVQRLRHLDRRRGGKAAMAIDQDVDVRADRIPDQLHAPPRLPQLVLPGHAGHGVEGNQLERTPARPPPGRGTIRPPLPPCRPRTVGIEADASHARGPRGARGLARRGPCRGCPTAPARCQRARCR